MRHRIVGTILPVVLVRIQIDENNFLMPVFLSKENLLRAALKRRVVGKTSFFLLSSCKCMIFSFIRKRPLKAQFCICKQLLCVQLSYHDDYCAGNFCAAA